MPRSFVLTIVALLAAAIAGWSLVWSAAARKTGAVLDAWIENESQLGRNWTCSERRISGYPLDIEVSCADLQFRGEVFAENFAGSLGGFHALASVLQPDRVRLRLEPPFAGTTPDGDIDLRIEWSALNVALEGRPNALTRLSLDGAQLTVKGRPATSARSTPGRNRHRRPSRRRPPAAKRRSISRSPSTAQ